MLQALKNVTEKQSKFFINELHCFALNLAFPSCRNKHLNAVLELFASIKSVCCLRRNLAERIAGTFSLSFCMNEYTEKESTCSYSFCCNKRKLPNEYEENGSATAGIVGTLRENKTLATGRIVCRHSRH